MADEKSRSSSGTSDDVKGRTKEAAGALTDDEKLKREGKADRAQGKVKQKADEAIDKVRRKLRGE